jgi:predicted nucleic acid-binding protein
MNYLFDTNILIDLQANKIPEKSKDFIIKEINDDFSISFITYLEFMSFKNITKSMKEFINLASIIGINKQIMDKTIELRKSSNVKLPDCIIAATSILYSKTLITNNKKDFSKFEELKTYIPT